MPSFIKALSLKLRQKHRTTGEPEPTAASTGSARSPFNHVSTSITAEAVSRADGLADDPMKDSGNRTEDATNEQKSPHILDPTASTPPDPTRSTGKTMARNSMDFGTAQSSMSAPLRNPCVVSTAARESSLASTSAWTPERFAEWLWNTAYESLEAESPRIIYEYERVVFAQTVKADDDDFGAGLSFRPTSSLAEPLPNGLPERTVLMNSFLEASLHEPDLVGSNETRNGGARDAGHWQIPNSYEIDGTRTRTSTSLMRALIQNSRNPSIP